MLARLAFVALSLVAIVTFADWWSSPTVPCSTIFHESSKSGKDNKGTEKYCSTGKAVAVWRYVGNAIDAWHDDLTAAATIVIAIFTTILGIFTVSLARSTRIAANAAKQSADAAVAIELPVFKMGVTPLHYSQSLKKDGPLRHHCGIRHLEFANLGRTKAFPIAVRFGYTAGDSLPEEPVYPLSKSFPIETIWDPAPENTVKLLSIAEFEFDITSTFFDDLRAKRTKFWFYCSLGYLDFMQIRHDAGFCWERHESPGRGTFTSDPNPAYNRKT